MSDVNVREITEKHEKGVKDLYESDKYGADLQTMSRFNRYSTRNTLLIHMQMPGATACFLFFCGLVFNSYRAVSSF